MMVTREVASTTGTLADQYLKAWQTRDVEAIIALHTPDSVFTSVATGREAIGRDAVRKAITEIFAVWPDLRFKPVRVYTTPGLIVAESIAEATQALPLPLGDVVVMPNGRRVSFAVADILALENGLVKRKDSHVDALGYMRAMRGAAA
jgi:uncharacterized protein (TIGR02246 family)